MGQANRSVVLFALTIVAMGYAGHHLISKVAASGGSPPLVIAALRALGGTMVMYITAHFIENDDQDSKASSTSRALNAIRDWKSFLHLGMFMAGNVVGFLSGVHYLSALTCSVMQPAVPAIAAVVCLVCGVEKISPTKAASILMSGIGAVVVLKFGERTAGAGVGASSTSDLLIGSLFITMNVFSNACYWVFQKQVLKKHPPVTATATAYLFATGIICALALGGGYGLDAWTLNWDPKTWTCMAYLVFISTAFNYCVQGWANSQSSPTVVTVFMTVPPFFATIISAAFLGVIITTGQVIGAIIITIGLALNVKSQADAEQNIKQELTEKSKLVSELA